MKTTERDLKVFPPSLGFGAARPLGWGEATDEPSSRPDMPSPAREDARPTKFHQCGHYGGGAGQSVGGEMCERC